MAASLGISKPWATITVKDSLPLYLLRLVRVEEITDLQLKYSVTAYDSRAVIYSKIWSGFESELI